MGTIYYIGCRDCGVFRDLDKAYFLTSANSRKEVLACAEEVKKESFRSALIVSFMSEHRGHDCVLFDEHDDSLMEAFAPNYPAPNEENLWSEGEQPPVRRGHPVVRVPDFEHGYGSFGTMLENVQKQVNSIHETLSKSTALSVIPARLEAALLALDRLIEGRVNVALAPETSKPFCWGTRDWKSMPGCPTCAVYPSCGAEMRRTHS